MSRDSEPEQIRSFIAIELSRDVKNGLAWLRRVLEREQHRFVRWVDTDGIHLTLKFLGNIPSSQVAEINKLMEETTQLISPFHLEISGLGAFPNLKQPRVLWVGIGGEVDELSKLQGNIDFALASLGFVRENRPFKPHLTLARVRQTASPLERKTFGELVISADFRTSYSLDVETINLMRSQLTPTGAIYTRLSVVKLQAQKG